MKPSPRHSFSPTYFKPAVTKDFRRRGRAAGSTFRFDLGESRLNPLKRHRRCGRKPRDEFADRLSNVALGDGLRGDDEEERLRAEFRSDDLSVAARDGNRARARTAERLDERVHL